MAVGTPVLATPVVFDQTAGNVTTASFTPPAGALLIAGSAYRSDTPISPATCTTAGVTWTEINQVIYDVGVGSRSLCAVFATIATGAALTVTVEASGSQRQHLAVIQISGAAIPTRSAVGANSGGNPTCTLPRVPVAGSISLVVGAFNDAFAIDPPTGFTELAEALVKDLQIEVAYDLTPITDVIGYSTGNSRSTAIAMEIEPVAQAASGGGALSASIGFGGRGVKGSPGGGALPASVSLGGRGVGVFPHAGWGQLIVTCVLDAGTQPDLDPHVWHADIRLGGVGGRNYIPPPLPPVFRGTAQGVFYEVGLWMSASSYWPITDRVRAITIDRKLNTWPGGIEAGICEVMLDDTEGGLAPTRTDIHGGNLRPNLPISIKATYQDPATSQVSNYHLFTGFVDQITVAPQIADRTVTLSCLDAWKLLQQRTAATSIMLNNPVSSIVARVFTAAGISSSYWLVDPITDVLPFAWFREESLSQVIADLVAGGGYAAFVTTDGMIRIAQRYFDIGGRAAEGADYENMADLSWSVDEAQTINRITVEADIQLYVQSVQGLTALASAYPIPASAQVQFTIPYQDPRNQGQAAGVNMVSPTPTSDWLMNSASGGTGSNLTATGSLTAVYYGDAALVTAFNGTNNAAYLTLLRLRGEPILPDGQISIVKEVASSAVLYGYHDATLNPAMHTSQLLIDTRADDILEQYADPPPVVSLVTVDDFPNVFRIELGNVVRITNGQLGFDKQQFTVYGLSHDLRADDVGLVHQQTMELRRSRSREAFILDTDQLDVDRIGR